MNLDFARVELNEQLGTVRRNLPLNAGQPSIRAYVPEEFETEQFFACSLESNLPASELRELATGIISGQPEEYNSLFMIGIEVDKEGVMSITDSAKLQAAIDNDPDEVAALFNTPGIGIAARMDNYLDNVLGPDGKVTSRIETVNANIDSIQDEIEEFQDYLDDLEEKLLIQWSRVEQLLSANDSLSLFMAQRLFPSYQEQS